MDIEKYVLEHAYINKIVGTSDTITTHFGLNTTGPTLLNDDGTFWWKMSNIICLYR